jgi:hypothetical protein
MSAPELEPLPEEIARLLSAERSAPGPAPEVALTVKARVSKSVGLLAAAGASTAAAGGTGIASSILGGAASLKVVTAAFVVGTLAGGGTVAVVRSPEIREIVIHVPAPPPSPALLEEPSAADPPALPPPPAPALPPPRLSGPPKVAGALKGAPPRRAMAAEEGGMLASEQLILERARSALLRGDAEEALATLSRHERDHPQGQLAEERSVLRIQALLRSGRRDEAEAKRAQFKEQYPKSLLLPVVDAMQSRSP